MTSVIKNPRAKEPHEVERRFGVATIDSGRGAKKSLLRRTTSGITGAPVGVRTLGAKLTDPCEDDSPGELGFEGYEPGDAGDSEP